MNAKNMMIEEYQRSQESPWLILAKRIVREHIVRKAVSQEVPHAEVRNR